MRSSLGKVATNLLTPGMVLAADVRDHRGRLLLGAGTELAKSHIYVLHLRSILEADIEGVEEEQKDLPGADLQDTDLLAAAEAAIIPFFCHTDITHPAIKELLRIGTVRKARHGIL